MTDIRKAYIGTVLFGLLVIVLFLLGVWHNSALAYCLSILMAIPLSVSLHVVIYHHFLERVR